MEIPLLFAPSERPKVKAQEPKIIAALNIV